MNDPKQADSFREYLVDDSMARKQYFANGLIAEFRDDPPALRKVAQRPRYLDDGFAEANGGLRRIARDVFDGKTKIGACSSSPDYLPSH
jgi:hypothetical protein